MPGRPIWGFYSVFDFHVAPTLWLTECEIYIIWTLGEEGAESVYSIANKTRLFPETNAELPPDSRDWKKHQNGVSYDYHFVHSKVKELGKKGLIKIGSSASQEPKVGLTFLGLVFYLQNLRDIREGFSEKLKNSLNHYKTLVPLFAHWESLESRFGTEKCTETFEKTVKDFRLWKAEFRIRRLDLKYDSFEVQTSENEYRRDERASEYLASPELTTLRNCYIAFLALHDLHLLSGESTEEANKIVSSLASERELSYFEKRNVGFNCLFDGERLKEFFPKYAGIECVFTGMFVKDLLWNEKIIKKEKEEAKTPDYEVEFY